MSLLLWSWPCVRASLMTQERAGPDGRAQGSSWPRSTLPNTQNTHGEEHACLSVPAPACGGQQQGVPAHTGSAARASGRRSVKCPWAGSTCVSLLGPSTWEAAGQCAPEVTVPMGGIYGMCPYVCGRVRCLHRHVGGVSMWEVQVYAYVLKRCH